MVSKKTENNKKKDGNTRGRVKDGHEKGTNKQKKNEKKSAQQVRLRETRQKRECKN